MSNPKHAPGPHRYATGAKACVRDEYQQLDESPHRGTVGVVIGHEWNDDYKCTDNIIQFASGDTEPFGDHELEVVNE